MTVCTWVDSRTTNCQGSNCYNSHPRLADRDSGVCTGGIVINIVHEDRNNYIDICRCTYVAVVDIIVHEDNS